jgi:hypothetical protein
MPFHYCKGYKAIYLKIYLNKADPYHIVQLLVTPADCGEIYDVIIELYLKIFYFKKKLKYAGVQVSKHEEMQAFKYANMQVCRNASSKYLWPACLQAFRYASLQAYKDLPICISVFKSIKM